MKSLAERCNEGLRPLPRASAICPSWRCRLWYVEKQKFLYEQLWSYDVLLRMLL
jgi:hypothetical protein